jgi:RNase H-fold protein (predicted Holliday junction resolvase)
MSICDAEGRVAVGAGRIQGVTGKALIAKIVEEARSRSVDGVVVGQPTTTRGNEEVLEGVARLVEQLSKHGLKVALWSEAYTSAEALTARKFFGGKKSSDKSWTDEAAAIILSQDYLAWSRGKHG